MLETVTKTVTARARNALSSSSAWRGCSSLWWLPVSSCWSPCQQPCHPHQTLEPATDTLLNKTCRMATLVCCWLHEGWQVCELWWESGLAPSAPPPNPASLAHHSPSSASSLIAVPSSPSSLLSSGCFFLFLALLLALPSDFLAALGRSDLPPLEAVHHGTPGICLESMTVKAKPQRSSSTRV